MELYTAHDNKRSCEAGEHNMPHCNQGQTTERKFNKSKKYKTICKGFQVASLYDIIYKSKMYIFVVEKFS